MRHLVAPLVLSLFALGFLSCSDDTEQTSSPANTAGTAGSGGTAGGCPGPDDNFPVGDANGHAEPQGAKAAGQARAGRITSASQIKQPADARQRVRVGDFLLTNEKIAVYIEDKGLSDGYARFGGEILAVDRVGDDGLPAGVSRYGETLIGLSIRMVDPDSVTVLNDGSDGKAAVVRVAGRFKEIPFMGFLSALFAVDWDLKGVYDFVLEPGAEMFTVRVGVSNPTPDAIDFTGNELHGFFHSSRNRMFTSEAGFGSQSGQHAFVGFEGDEGWSFAYRKPEAATLGFGIEVSGFQYFVGPGFSAPGCAMTELDHVQIIPSDHGSNGLLATIARVDGDTWRSIDGTLKNADGVALADTFVHVLDAQGKYLGRTKTDAQGKFVAQAPAAGEVKLVATAKGYPKHDGLVVGGSESKADISLAAFGKIHVIAKDDQNRALPVRVQIIPTTPVADIPEEWGIAGEVNGRVHQEFAVSGETTLPVPPGEHTVIVTRGYEYELSQQVVNVTSGQTVDVNATLEHSVDSAGVMCADFHIHSYFSADSSDPVLNKVKSALADGLDLPVSSEHEWVVDFQPIIEQLGAAQWAFGIPSEELTTFTWGHFGVVPLTPRVDSLNNGAVDWVGKDPTDVFAAVRALPEDPFFIVNHPMSTGFGGYFSAAQFKLDTAKGKDGFWSDNFDGIEVFNDSDFDSNREKTVAAWFSLLNSGKTFYAVGSSDSHSVRTSPVGYPRTCIQFGHDDPTLMSPIVLRDGLRTGAYNISGGLYMTVSTSGGKGPGAVISGATSETFTVTVQAPSWLDASELEVIVNGETTQTVALTPATSPTSAKRWENQITVPIDASKPRSWVVFHARGGVDLAPLHPGRSAFAASNPIFFTP